MYQTKEKAMVDDIKATPPEGEDKDMVSKVSLDEAIARSEKLEKDLEDVRMEVLTPEYQRFLDADEKSAGDKPAGDKPVDNASDTTISDDAYTKMSNKEIFEAAKKAAVDEIRGTLTQQEADTKKAGDARTQREIAAFSKTHEDYNTFRPIMYGISLDPKNADLSLSQLYEAAKAHVKSIHTEPSDEDKRKSRESSSERPGGDSSSLEKLAKMTDNEIAAEAMAEVEEKLGPLPTT